MPSVLAAVGKDVPVKIAMHICTCICMYMYMHISYKCVSDIIYTQSERARCEIVEGRKRVRGEKERASQAQDL